MGGTASRIGRKRKWRGAHRGPMVSEGARWTAPGTPPPAAGDDRCLRCGSALQSMGVEQFRTGGTSGGWKLLFGEWAELGEQLLPLELLACPSCRRVEARVPRP